MTLKHDLLTALDSGDVSHVEVLLWLEESLASPVAAGYTDGLQKLFDPDHKIEEKMRVDGLRVVRKALHNFPGGGL